MISTGKLTASSTMIATAEIRRFRPVPGLATGTAARAGDPASGKIAPSARSIRSRFGRPGPTPSVALRGAAPLNRNEGINPMLTLHLDVPLTRRMKLHHVLDDHAQVLHTSSQVAQSLAWLWENGYHRFAVECETPKGVHNRFFMSFDHRAEPVLEDAPEG